MLLGTTLTLFPPRQLPPKQCEDGPLRVIAHWSALKISLALIFSSHLLLFKPNLAFKGHLQSHFRPLLTTVTSLVFGPVLNYILPYPVSSCRLFLIPLSEF